MLGAGFFVARSLSLERADLSSKGRTRERGERMLSTLGGEGEGDFEMYKCLKSA